MCWPFVKPSDGLEPSTPLYEEGPWVKCVCFAGAGAVMVEAKTQALGHVGVALTFGLVIMAMIYAVGHVSGAHFNPAVSFAFALTRHFPWPRVGTYWAAQVGGAVAAAALLRASLGLQPA
jgi:aquaporin NIP